MKYYIKVFKNYAVFSGRARRREFWYFLLFNILISYGLEYLEDTFNVRIIYFISDMYSLAVIIPSIAVGVRRMHDTGRSGWFLLVPIVDLIIACTDSDAGDNFYGANPKIAPHDNQ
jgi:uncharacterized membrane protein YhaH (DUF805 family)